MFIPVVVGGRIDLINFNYFNISHVVKLLLSLVDRGSSRDRGYFSHVKTGRLKHYLKALSVDDGGSLDYRFRMLNLTALYSSFATLVYKIWLKLGLDFLPSTSCCLSGNCLVSEFFRLLDMVSKNRTQNLQLS